MKAIFSSKLYRNSSRKEAISAALNNPINQELVLQLRSYLDEEAIQEALTQDSAADLPADTAAESTETETVQDTVDTVSDEDTVTDDVATENSSTADDTASDTAEDSDPEVFKMGTISSTRSSETDDSDSADDSSEDSDEPIDSSTTLDSSPVVASQCVIPPSLDTIQGQLNSVDDTCGVVRVKQTGDELWVYFNDKKNLNNVMEAVIDRLNAAGFYQLEFNRLARTDNAIVFQIASVSTEVNNGPS